MRAMVTTATGLPALRRSACRMAAPGIFSPFEAMSTAADWVGCLSNFRRPNFLRTGEPEAGASGAVTVTVAVTARSRPAWWRGLARPPA